MFDVASFVEERTRDRESVIGAQPPQPGRFETLPAGITQVGARRNALLACTTLANRRREHHPVEEFLRSVNALTLAVSAASDS